MPSSNYAYSIVEPHPNIVGPKIHAGRGGAGNVTKLPSVTTRGADASGPAARASTASLSKPRLAFTSGRGGAGNVHNASERAMFSFDEELQRQVNQDQNLAPVYHVGRGGAGNVTLTNSATSTIRRNSDGSSTRSTNSVESGADIATRKFKEGFRRMTGRDN